MLWWPVDGFAHEHVKRRSLICCPSNDRHDCTGIACGSLVILLFHDTILFRKKKGRGDSSQRERGCAVSLYIKTVIDKAS